MNEDKIRERRILMIREEFERSDPWHNLQACLFGVAGTAVKREGLTMAIDRIARYFQHLEGFDDQTRDFVFVSYMAYIVGIIGAKVCPTVSDLDHLYRRGRLIAIEELKKLNVPTEGETS